MKNNILAALASSTAFAFFVMCPRIAGMCAVLSEARSVNPYLVALLGTIFAAPLLALMVFLTMKFGVHVAILAAVLTDLLAAALMGFLRPRYAIEIALIALFVWLGVLLARLTAPRIEKAILSLCS